MAGENILAALQNPLYSAGDTYSGIGAGALAQSLPALVDPYASNGQNAAYVFGGSILAALLGNMAKSDAAEENAAIATKQANFMNADPAQRLAMTQQDPMTFSKLQAALGTNALMQQAQDESVKRQLEIQKPFDIEKENRAKENQVLMQIDPRLTGAKTAEDAAKLYDNERNLTNDFTKHPIVSDYKYKETNMKALTEAYKDTAGTSDFEIIRRTAQMVEPGLAVRADDQDSLIGAASALGMSVQAVKNIVSGDTKLDPNVRTGMMRIAQRAYDSSLGNYNTLRTNFVDRATGGKLNPDLVVPYGAAEPFGKIYPDVDISAGLGTSTAGVDPRAQQIAEAKILLDQGVPAAEVANTLRLKYGTGAPRG